MNHYGHGQTDIGKVKAQNEDAFLIDQEMGLYVVCDGLGGHVGGEIASKMACQVILDHISDRIEELRDSSTLDSRTQIRAKTISLVEEAIKLANQEIFKESQSDDAAKKGMGCTVVMLLITGRHATVAHVGDSRVYLFRRSKLHQLTKDHSSIDLKMKRGEISPQQARELADDSPMTRAVGTQEETNADVIFMEMSSNDQFVLCTDGLTYYVNNNEIQKHLEDHSAEEMLAKLVDLANERGGKDNITALSVTIDTAHTKADDDLQRWFDLLKSMPLFKHFNFVELLRVLSHSTIRPYGRHGNVLNEGEPNEHLYVCLSGKAQMVKQGQVLREIKPGDFFGEMSVIDKRPAWVDVITVTPAVILAIEREFFLTILNEEPHLSARLLWRLTHELIQRLRQTSDELGWSVLSSSSKLMDTIHAPRLEDD